MPPWFVKSGYLNQCSSAKTAAYGRFPEFAIALNRSWANRMPREDSFHFYRVLDSLLNNCLRRFKLQKVTKMMLVGGWSPYGKCSLNTERDQTTRQVDAVAVVVFDRARRVDPHHIGHIQTRRLCSAAQPTKPGKWSTLYCADTWTVKTRVPRMHAKSTPLTSASPP
jgi:hypothetical protein